MQDAARSPNLYVCSILTLGIENQTDSDSGQVENLGGKKMFVGNELGWS
jgi:hypothetical protein